MHHVTALVPHPLHDLAATRQLEAALAAGLPAHTLMQRAGLATARLALAIAPHARSIWVACGPGNNGGDGLEAAMHLQHWGKNPMVTWLGSQDSAPLDARASMARAKAAGVAFTDAPPPVADLCIDALLGIGVTRPVQGTMADWIAHINSLRSPVLAIDLPSGLTADTGTFEGICVQASHTLCLLTLKPGLFTAQGRDMAAQVWFDALSSDTPGSAEPRATLLGSPAPLERRHDSHKGSYGDLAVIGGAPGMTGAALLAATAALHHGAGRVFVALLDGSTLGVDTGQPELMFRPVETLEAAQMTMVCGCGGGAEIAAELPRMLSKAPRLVLDADALNAVANDSQLEQLLRARQARGRQTVLTPHPLEAARLLGGSAAAVQHNRLSAAEKLARRFACTVVLKGSGTVIAAAGQITAINPTGSARLATAGTGDVLAGMIGARLAMGQPAYQAACEAVWLHGHAADTWPAGQALTAAALARHT
jgi:ADP-dependent NAD(P)H-hydrate dehydratase / NAD(P)H-hydrate epimerase